MDKFCSEQLYNNLLGKSTTFTFISSYLNIDISSSKQNFTFIPCFYGKFYYKDKSINIDDNIFTIEIRNNLKFSKLPVLFKIRINSILLNLEGNYNIFKYKRIISDKKIIFCIENSNKTVSYLKEYLKFLDIPISLFIKYKTYEFYNNNISLEELMKDVKYIKDYDKLIEIIEDKNKFHLETLKFYKRINQ